MAVQIECICPALPDEEPRHPDGDTITLRERLDFRAAATVRNRLAVANEEKLVEGEILAILLETYVLVGVESWSVVDAANKPVPPSREAIAEYLLANYDAATEVGNAADGLYTKSVILPLLVRASSSSPPTPITGSTSATGRSSRRNRTPSRRSSTTTTPTDATATMSASPAGGSS